MKFEQYVFSDVGSLDDVDCLGVRLVNPEGVPPCVWTSLFTDNAVAFEGRPGLATRALYRHKDGLLDVISPFGRYGLPVAAMDLARTIGLLLVQGKQNFSALRVEARGEWRDEDGRLPAPGALKAKALGRGVFEPLHWELSFRGIDSKPDFRTVVLLPSPAESVRAKDGCARVQAGGREFVLPPGRASENVLAGKVQWGMPDETGFFVLQDR